MPNPSSAPPPAPRDWNVLTMLEWATTYLGDKAVPSPRLSIEWILSHVLACKRLDLYLKFDRPISPEELSAIKPLLLRRAKHEPLQYITGSTDFYGLELQTRPGALIPRPETEQLVELILEQHEATSKRVLDLGTGSGCIPIALKHERPGWQLCGSDISRKALELAKLNASRLELELLFVEHDFFEADWDDDAFPAPFDLIVSNPPYIPQAEYEDIEEQVRVYEPGIALFYPDVMQVYRALISFARKHLSEEGEIYVEIHEQLSDDLRTLFEKSFQSHQLINDYSGKPRFIKASHIL